LKLFCFYRNESLFLTWFSYLKKIEKEIHKLQNHLYFLAIDGLFPFQALQKKPCRGKDINLSFPEDLFEYFNSTKKCWPSRIKGFSTSLKSFQVEITKRSSDTFAVLKKTCGSYILI